MEPDLKKNKLATRILAKWTKLGSKTSFFCYFLKFGSLVFLKIAYNDSLQQCLTTGGGKIDEKKFGAQM